MKPILLTLIQIYRYFFAPLIGRNCRFYPSCSEYAIQAVDRHGSIRGFRYVISRLCRCHPWHPGGYDPVP